jgi:hypothetical protein
MHIFQELESQTTRSLDKVRKCGYRDALLPYHRNQNAALDPVGRCWLKRVGLGRLLFLQSLPEECCCSRSVTSNGEYERYLDNFTGLSFTLAGEDRRSDVGAECQRAR